jgi:hypothetical protein
MDAHDDLPEKSRYLARMALAPAIWLVHFLASYVTAAFWCRPAGTRDRPIGSLDELILLYTVAAVVGITAAAWSGYQRHAFAAGSPPHDSDTPTDRHRFLGFASLLLAALSLVATLYTVIAVGFFDVCG